MSVSQLIRHKFRHNERIIEMDIKFARSLSLVLPCIEMKSSESRPFLHISQYIIQLTAQWIETFATPIVVCPSSLIHD